MANILFANYAYSQLAAGLSSGGTTLSVTTTHGSRFPSPTGAEYFYLVIENASLAYEIVKVTARAGDSLTIVRGQDNTAAQAWNAGDVVGLRMVAAALNDAIAAAEGANVALLAGAAFTGDISTTGTLAVTGATTLTGAVAANGGVTVPASATGDQAPRASETVRNVGGAARMPSWNTAGRPASPAAGDAGWNTDLLCNETYNGTEWEQEGWQYGSAASIPAGGLTVSSIPAWAKEYRAVVHGASHNSGSSQNLRFQIGPLAGLITTGYVGGITNLDTAANVALSTDIRSVGFNASSLLSADLHVFVANGGWRLVLNGNFAAGTGMIATAFLPGAGPLSQINVGLTGGSFDAGTMQVAWRK
jgi:hypothetical protein